MLVKPDRRGLLIDRMDVRVLREHLTGEVIVPSDDAYDAARRVWNAAVDRHPGLIVRSRNLSDVVHTVDFARSRGLPLAVRSGGHSLAGHGTVDGGIVADLSQMKWLNIRPERRVARAEAGLTWGEYSVRANAFGLATPAGDMMSVGVGGLTVGGGIGWLSRKHGLTVDSLLSAEVVTADGRVLTASAEEHPDLFWALRGGGGNFGIVTSFQFRLHPVDTILGGALVYPATAEVLEAYAAAAAAAPDELTTITFVMPAPPAPSIPAEAHGKLVTLITACYAGDLEEGQRALAPLRSLGGVKPLADATRPMPYPDLFQITAGGTKSHPSITRGGYLRAVDAATVDLMLEHLRRMPSPTAMLELRVLGGAIGRVAADATAYSHRDKEYFALVTDSWQGPAEAGQHTAWLEGFWRELEPRTVGAYSSFLGDEGEARVRQAYSAETYRRLAAVKRRYDADNLFRLNQNVKPAK